ncbi:MAG TPA: cysteine desulfurase family protein [Candidatus Methylacidiphilales bacterium]|nr:cysteine desulfurase family protein [Candidatus Methylacidiphilales bacterium]
MPRFYLDENATAALDPRVQAVMEPLLRGTLGNPSSLHTEGRRARGEIDSARDSLAAWLKVKPSEIIFTSGGTESCNLAVQGLACAHGDKGRHLITAKTEHHAVLNACRALERWRGFEITWLDTDTTGLVDPGELERAIRPGTILVSIMSANNETGVLQPMRELGAICTRHGVLFHTDAIQSAGKEPLDLATWQVGALSLAAHKFHGPPGTGLVWLKSGTPIARLMEGGSHENERRPGTENAPAIAGFGAAARLFGHPDPAETQRQFRWTERLWRELSSLGGVYRNGHPERRLANTLNVSFLGLHGEDFLIALDLAGLAVSSGSACLAGSVQPSHVLAAMGAPDGHASATVRFSIGAHIRDEDLEEIANRVRQVVTHQRSLRGWTSDQLMPESFREQALA